MPGRRSAATCMPGCLRHSDAGPGEGRPRGQMLPGLVPGRPSRGSHPNSLKESNHFQKGKNAAPSRTGRRECVLGCWEALRQDRPSRRPTLISWAQRRVGQAGTFSLLGTTKELGISVPLCPRKVATKQPARSACLGDRGPNSPSTRDARRRQTVSLPVWQPLRPNARGIPSLGTRLRMKHQPVPHQGVRLQRGPGVQLSESSGRAPRAPVRGHNPDSSVETQVSA